MKVIEKFEGKQATLNTNGKTEQQSKNTSN